MERMMKCTMLVLLFAVTLVSCTSEQVPITVKEAPAIEPEGPYLGQEPPTDTPQLFAPGVVSTGLYERDVAMMPDGRELYFSVVLGVHDRSAIMVTRQGDDGRWSQPEVASFSGRHRDLEPAITQDGSRLYFASRRPRTDGFNQSEDLDIWYVEREGDGWGPPQNPGPPVNTAESEFFPSITQDGTLYFTRQFERVSSVILRAPAVEGGFGDAKRLDAGVNDGSTQFNGFVARDESYLIFGAAGRADSVGAVDYYISFRNDDGSWRGPFNLGPRINTPTHLEYSPYVSPDGKQFFFMATRSRYGAELATATLDRAMITEIVSSPGNGLPDIWWVGTGFIERIRAANPPAEVEP
jgi:Tol biopolymer transport system component